MKTELEANRTTYGKVIDSINASLDVLRGILKDGKIDENEIKQGIEIVEDFKESLDKISEEFNDKDDKKDKE